MNIIPLVNEYFKNETKYTIKNFKIIVLDKYLKAVSFFEKELLNKLIVDENENPYSFIFEVNKKLKSEEYNIDMQENKALIQAKDGRGFFYATRSLAFLLNLNTAGKVNAITGYTYSIHDKPRYHFRSFMIDVCRHFFDVKEIKKIIDLMSLLKFNYFHWHLSDDQGFRIDFKTFPKLKSVASKRNKTKINGLENDDFDNTPYEYCYSVEEIKDVISYAKDRYIEIIPEIDLPGHTTAIVSAYKELHCLNQQVDVETSFGVFKEIMCPSKEVTYDFCEKLLTELVALFKDSKYIHIGGDEVNPQNWTICPDCQKKLEELKLKDVKYLQEYFTNRICTYLTSLNKKVISWHDGMTQNTNKDVIMQYWTWEMNEYAIDLINNGRNSIYSPCSQFYFNDPYAELPLKTTYTKPIHLKNLSNKGKANIMGVEGCIWSEWIINDELLEVLINPRLACLSEKAWTLNKNLNFKDFLLRNENFEKTLTYKNVAFADKKIALAKGKKYRDTIAKAFRSNDKLVEYKLYKKHHSINF